MLKLRRGRVVGTDPLTVLLDGEAEGRERRAWVDQGLLGPCEVGDEVVVNTEALDIGLGSGGFDIVHVNLTRGLAATGSSGEHVMKLNYSSLQHPVASVERPVGAAGSGERVAVPVLAIGLHGHLAPAAWAFGRASGRALRLGYIQTGGGALPGSFSRDVARLRADGLVDGHVTAGPAWGGAAEAISLIGGIDAAESLGWDAVVAGPGPGILGSATALGHGGMAALDVLNAALGLGLPGLLCPRLSHGDQRPRHRGLSHHSQAVLAFCLAPVEVPLPEGVEEMLGEDAPEGGLDRLVGSLGRVEHRTARVRTDLAGYLESGLPHRSMGRDLDQDPAFFAGPLAAGTRLAELAASA